MAILVKARTAIIFIYYTSLKLTYYTMFKDHTTT